MKENKIAWLRFIMSFSLLLAVFTSSSMFALAADKGLAGEITVFGNNGGTESLPVRLNGEHIFSGQTFFSSGLITTSEKNSATINLGKLGHISLAPNSALSISFTENNISGKLTAGQIRVFAKEGVSVNIQTTDGVVNNDASQTGVYTIDVQSGVTETFAEQGKVSLNNGQTNVPQGGPQNSKKNKLWIPLIAIAGVLGTAAIIILATGDDDNVTSPVR